MLAEAVFMARDRRHRSVVGIGWELGSKERLVGGRRDKELSQSFQGSVGVPPGICGSPILMPKGYQAN